MSYTPSGNENVSNLVHIKDFSLKCIKCSSKAVKVFQEEGAKWGWNGEVELSENYKNVWIRCMDCGNRNDLE